MQLREKVGYFLTVIEPFRSAKTSTWYADKLLRVVAFFEQRCAVIEVEELELVHVVQLFRYLRDERRCSESTLAGYRRALRRLFKWLETIPGLSGLTERLLGGLPTVTSPRRVPEALVEAEVTSLFAASADEGEAAILATLLSTGIRAGEFVALQVGDVDFRNNRIRVRRPGYRQPGGPKGGHERLVPLPPRLIGILANYIGRVRARLDREGSPYLFLNRRGAPYTTQSLYSIVRRCLEDAGIHKRGMGAHLLRRTFASRLRARGTSKSDIAALMGHSQTTGTRVLDESYLSGEANEQALNHTPDPLDDVATLAPRRQR
jgi:site-specific recombinase XerD